MENARFELKIAANTVDMAASSSKMLQVAPTCCKFHGKREVRTQKMLLIPLQWHLPAPKCCK
jgi:hypothetical protein